MKENFKKDNFKHAVKSLKIYEKIMNIIDAGIW